MKSFKTFFESYEDVFIKEGGNVEVALKEIKDSDTLKNLVVSNSYTGEINLPNLVMCTRNILSDMCTALILPSLERVFDLSCNHAQKVDLRNLKAANGLYIHRASDVNLDSLEKVTSLEMYGQKEIRLNKLKAGYMFRHFGEVVELPELLHVGGPDGFLELNKARSVDLSKLEVSFNHLYLDKVEGHLDLSKLEICKGILNCQSATTIDVSNLKVFKRINAHSANEITINEEADRSKIEAPSSCYINTAKLKSQKVGRVLSKL
jgi:hypothetical protein